MKFCNIEFYSVARWCKKLVYFSVQCCQIVRKNSNFRTCKNFGIQRPSPPVWVRYWRLVSRVWLGKLKKCRKITVFRSVPDGCDSFTLAKIGKLYGPSFDTTFRFRDFGLVKFSASIDHILQDGSDIRVWFGKLKNFLNFLSPALKNIFGKFPSSNPPRPDAIL